MYALTDDVTDEEFDTAIEEAKGEGNLSRANVVRKVKPEKANGVKFEMFVFDALPFATNPVIIETRREDDFSPVKNAEGLDSPKTCRDDQLRQFARWFKANGAAIATDDTGLPPFAVEVSPLFGYDEDSFADAWGKLSPTPAITAGLYLE